MILIKNRSKSHYTKVLSKPKLLKINQNVLWSKTDSNNLGLKQIEIKFDQKFIKNLI